LALFRLGKGVELVVGLTLIAGFYLGGVANPLEFVLKTVIILMVLVGLQTLMTRMRIDQVVRWWRFGALLALLQLFLMIAWNLWKGGIL
jgi:NADH-quinone oxidoreductase subunit H